MGVPKAGALAKASDWTTVFPLDTDAWTAYTPTLTQSVTVTKTVEYARYTKVGRLTIVQLSLAVTGAGTAANAVVVGMPFDTVNFRCVGTGGIFDSSAGLWYTGMANRSGAATFNIQGSGVGSAFGSATFTAALASGDVVTADLTFEAAS